LGPNFSAAVRPRGDIGAYSNENVNANDSDKNEITYAITQRGFQGKYHARFSFRICFGKVGAIEGRDVRDHIDGMIRAVATIVDEIEAESRRLGLVAA
jgi:hypothetical protein